MFIRDLCRKIRLLFLQKSLIIFSNYLKEIFIYLYIHNMYICKIDCFFKNIKLNTYSTYVCVQQYYFHEIHIGITTFLFQLSKDFSNLLSNKYCILNRNSISKTLFDITHDPTQYKLQYFITTLASVDIRHRKTYSNLIKCHIAPQKNKQPFVNFF